MAQNEVKLIVTTDASGAITGLRKATDATRRFESDTESMVAKVKKHWLGITAVITGAYFAIQKGWNLAEQSAQFEQSKQAFNSMVQAMGLNAKAEFDKIKQASAGLIDNKSLIESANTAMSLGIPIEKLGELMEISRAKARDMGITTAQAFSDISRGIGRASPMILDNLGLALKVGAANEKMAESLGKTVEELTDKEKKMAILNAVLDAGKEALDRHNLATKTTNEKMQELTAIVKNLQLIMGQGLIRAVSGVYGAFQWLAAGALNLYGGLLRIKQAYEYLGSVNPLNTKEWKADWLKASQITGKDAETAFMAAEELAGKAVNSFKVMTSSAEELSTAMSRQKEDIEDNSKAIEKMANAAEAWKSKVDALNPALSRQDSEVKKLWADYEKLKKEFGDQAWLKEGMWQALDYINLKKQVEDYRESIRLEAEDIKEQIELAKDYRTALVSAYDDAIGRARTYYSESKRIGDMIAHGKDFLAGLHPLSAGDRQRKDKDALDEMIKNARDPNSIESAMSAIEKYMGKYQNTTNLLGFKTDFFGLEEEYKKLLNTLELQKSATEQAGDAWANTANRMIQDIRNVDSWIEEMQGRLSDLEMELNVDPAIQAAEFAKAQIDRILPDRMVKTLTIQTQTVPLSNTGITFPAAESQPLPEYARGGFITKTGLAVVHAGETVTPASRANSPMNYTFAGNININGAGKDGREIAREFDEEMALMIKRGVSKTAEALNG